MEIMQKDIIRRIHNFLLESPAEIQPAVFEYYNHIAR